MNEFCREQRKWMPIHGTDLLPTIEAIACQDMNSLLWFSFASRNAGHKTCSKILHLKCRWEPRTAQSIQRIDGLWDENNGWNLDMGDHWLVALNVTNLEALLRFDRQKLSFVPQGCGTYALPNPGDIDDVRYQDHWWILDARGRNKFQPGGQAAGWVWRRRNDQGNAHSFGVRGQNVGQRGRHWLGRSGRRSPRWGFLSQVVAGSALLDGWRRVC